MLANSEAHSHKSGHNLPWASHLIDFESDSDTANCTTDPWSVVHKSSELTEYKGGVFGDENLLGKATFLSPAGFEGGGRAARLEPAAF